MVELDVISHRLMIIMGIIMYIFGFIGNVLSICVFAIWSRLRRTTNEQNVNNRTGNSSLYLLAKSSANLILIIYPLLVRIYVDGYGHLVTEASALILCKLRFYVLQTALIVSLSCISLATFDRYLITSRSVFLRQLSTTRQTTIKMIIIIVIGSALHSIPIAIYYNKSIPGDCTITSVIYANYYLYFVIVCLYGIFPLCFVAVFGTLTYKQLKMLKHLNPNGHLNLDKQLSRMLLFQCITLIFSYIPYCIENIYFSKFVHTTLALTSYNLLIHIIAIILFYVNPVMNFYIFYASSPNFRQQVKKLFRNRHIIRNNQVNTITMTTQHNIH